MFEGFCKNPELRTLCLGAQTITQRLISKFRKILLLMFLWCHSALFILGINLFSNILRAQHFLCAKEMVWKKNTGYIECHSALFIFGTNLLPNILRAQHFLCHQRNGALKPQHLKFIGASEYARRILIFAILKQNFQLATYLSGSFLRLRYRQRRHPTAVW